MKLARWLLPLVSLALVLVVTWWDLSRSSASPGALHPAHAAAAALDGGAFCAGCHDGGGVAAASCLSCHDAIAGQRDEAVGLHGSLPPHELARCERCHPEHHGDAVPLIAPHAFARAGVADPAAYDHRHVPFVLTGVHPTLACARCHAAADAAAPPAGGRFLGLSQACTGCHDDLHGGAFGTGCEQCHGQQQAWREAPGFRHDRFALQGGHGRVACASCHEAGSGRDVASERARDLPVRGCRECHADPHGGGDAVAALRLADTADCARCHEPASWRPVAAPAEVHERAGFPLRGAHAEVACAVCHGDAETAGLWSTEPPSLAACATCHDSPHTQELVAAAGGCADCHDAADAAFAAGRLTAEQHRATGFALAPPHADVACASCHRGPTRAERFPGRDARDCRVCHGDAHAGQFRDGDLVRQCTECHAATHFAPHAFGPERHAATAFPLRFAHDAVACTRCHDQIVDGVRVFRGTPRACASCHADPHRGRFAAAAGCAQCHDERAFAPVTGDFDHARWTGFELAGAHRGVTCAMCHREPSGARLGAVPGTTCASCHVDPHAGQFAEAGATDCRRCHDAAAWTPARFDHAQSRFPLDDVHGRLACAACHKPWAVPGGSVVRYKPLGTTCGDCHRAGGDGSRRR